ncbi:oocyte zinc finger protein XlCOF6 [Microcaecilia unicolor]|uniref:Oocyte zinc finger protein XlCOF6-like n=1 Tax=Microcaecilia unicolor TaxID=1415580 RepID=A0A6P7XB17_9AMPH|nr:oocyte zinc finger protein XlCOF6-like [Microcaecilia unicolor]
MPAGASAQMQVTFEDITVSFSQEEWEYLDEEQKELYREVMKENYQTLISLGTGSPTLIPDIMSCIERGVELYIQHKPGSAERETGKSSCSENKNPRKNYTGTPQWEVIGNPKRTKMLSERDNEHISFCSNGGKKCKNWWMSENKQRNSTGDPALYEQRAIMDIAVEQRNQTEQVRDPVTLKSQHLSDTEKKSFTCTDCWKTFTHNKGLQGPKACTQKRPVSCSECGKGVFKKEEWLSNLSVFKERKVHTSRKYRKNNSNNEHLTNYQKMHNDERIASCPGFPKSSNQEEKFRRTVSNVAYQKIFSNMKTFRKHQKIAKKKSFTFINYFWRKKKHRKYQETPKRERQFTCTKSGKSFIQKQKLTIRHRIHTGDRPFICTECGKSFALERTLQAHQAIHRGVTQFVCTECNKSFTQKRALQEHQTIHTGIKSFKCVECGKSFTRKGTLRAHQAIHTGIKPFICTECGKSFKEKRTLQGHQAIHTGVRPFTCTKCEKSFMYKKTLQAHQAIHTGVKPFACTECGESFTRKRILQVHEAIHTGVKPFPCSECNKSFTRKRALQDHQAIHTGVKPFTCTECGKGFSQKQKFTIHQRIHTGVKPFICTECGKTFIQKKTLQVHQANHTGVKQFTCAECNKSFTQMRILQDHQAVHTGVKPFACTECGKSFTRKEKLSVHQRIHTRIKKLYMY